MHWITAIILAQDQPTVQACSYSYSCLFVFLLYCSSPLLKSQYSWINEVDCASNVEQITRKFRDEMSPKHGLLRGREFEMKGMWTVTQVIRNTNKKFVSYHIQFKMQLHVMCCIVLVCKIVWVYQIFNEEYSPDREAGWPWGCEAIHGRNFSIGFFLVTVYTRCFKFCMVISLALSICINPASLT